MPFDSKFQLTPEEMRKLGYQVVDQMVEHLSTMRDQPVMRLSSRQELEKKLREPLPEAPAPVEDILEKLQQDVWSNIGNVGHPRFFAFIPSPSNFVSVMADALVSGFNPFSGTWLEGSGPAEIELITIDWLREICGLPEGAGGLFVSGGSMANLTALAVARKFRLQDKIENAVIYFSDQTHSCVERAILVLGFHPDQIRKIQSDSAFRLRVDLLREALEADRSAGKTPFCLIANAGTTNTGAVDPLDELADLCESEGLWFHIDGAYGAAAAFSDKGRELLKGLGRADSLALDPHKWLFQPFEIGCVIVRDSDQLKATFRILPEYLKDTVRADEEVNFCDRGIQLTRSFRALKLWMSFKAFGAAAFREAISRGILMAEFAENRLRSMKNWEIVSPATLAIVAFRYAPEDSSEDLINELNQLLIRMVLESDFALATSTVLNGRTVLRLCTINPRTTAVDISETLKWLDSLAADASQQIIEKINQ
ncbi:MAG: aminotransferase class V-fold PLP-dependent enzyme [Acidobacteria bacterium]|nr:aminotransferase class V-fold PLP-dependent enzyme [Acidobacteriota bacterium]